MERERYRRAKLLFQELIDVSVLERDQVLSDRCSEDPEMELEVRSYLEAYERELSESSLSLGVSNAVGPFRNQGTPIDAGVRSSHVDPLDSSEDPSEVSAKRRGATAAEPSGSLLVEGARLAERYQLGGLLGVGGMGEVREAFDERTSLPVALKTFRTDRVEDPSAPRRLKQEYLVARSVSHPNICRVLDCGCHVAGGDEVWFLTMELLAGESLAERLRRAGALSSHSTIRWVEQMVKGLAAAHRAGVAHLDFKPANVMLVPGQRERAVITDFGIARAIGLARDPGAENVMGPVAGTLGYMAPEQLRGEETGFASDIHALGVVIYEMITGELPFSPSVLRARAEGDGSWENPPEWEQIKSPFDEILRRCLHPDPLQRFQRVEEIDRMLGRDSVEVSPAVAPVVPAYSVRSLPAERDAFFGRDSEIALLARALSGESRLVSLIGPPGIGKTRCAIHYAWKHADDWPGGIWLCDLSEAEDESGVTSSVAHTLGLPVNAKGLAERVGDALTGRGRCLLILDNFEQVVDCAGETIERWLQAEGDAHLLVSSRERLSLDGEIVQRLAPLSRAEAVQLFVERARRQEPDFVSSADNDETLVEIVELADRMPLAIELAAGRIGVMNPGSLVDRLRKRLQALSSENETMRVGLRAAIDESWQGLHPWEQSAWAQCALFEGGFSLEAAEQIIDLSAWNEAPWCVDVIQTLLDKSLLHLWTSTDDEHVPLQLRFAIYPSLQEYALERLAELDTSVSVSAEERHGSWFARLGRNEDADGFWKNGSADRIREVSLELDNVMAAVRRSVARRDSETGVPLFIAISALIEFRGGLVGDLCSELLEMSEDPLDRVRLLAAQGRIERVQGHLDSARDRFETALALLEQKKEPTLEAGVLHNFAVVLREQGRLNDARPVYEAAQSAHEATGSRLGVGRVRMGLASLRYFAGQPEEALTLIESARAIHKAIRDERGVAIATNYLGTIFHMQGRPEMAAETWREALGMYRRLRDRRASATVLVNIGLIDFQQGRTTDARASLEEAIRIFEAVGDRALLAQAFNHLGFLRFHAGEVDGAISDLETALETSQRIGDRILEGIALGNLGEVHAQAGQFAEARQRLETALAVHGETQAMRCLPPVLTGLARLDLNEGRFDEARKRLTESEELLQRSADPEQLALLHCARACLEVEVNDPERARKELAEGARLAESVAAGPDSYLGRQIAEARQIVEGAFPSTI